MVVLEACCTIAETSRVIERVRWDESNGNAGCVGVGANNVVGCTFVVKLCGGAVVCEVSVLTRCLLPEVANFSQDGVEVN